DDAEYGAARVASVAPVLPLNAYSAPSTNEVAYSTGTADRVPVPARVTFGPNVVSVSRLTVPDVVTVPVPLTSPSRVSGAAAGPPVRVRSSARVIGARTASPPPEPPSLSTADPVVTSK